MAFRTRSDFRMPLEVRLAIREAFVEPEERHAMAGEGMSVDYIFRNLEASQSLEVEGPRS